VFAGIVLLWLQRAIAQWSDRSWVFISAIAVAFALVLLVAWVLAAIGPATYRLLKSVSRGVGRAVSTDPEVRTLTTRYPRFFDWLARRTTLRSWRGLYLSVTVLSAAYFLSGFVSIARQTASAGLFAAYDTQISALLRAFRTPILTRVLWVFTVAGDTRVAFALTLAVVLLFLLWGRRFDALFVAACVAGGGLLGAVLKPLFHRARPSGLFTLITEPTSYSLPSGHALYALLFWGSIAFLLVRILKGTFARLAVVFSAIALIALTGLSRVYLGVHWPSDVLASWMLGLAWLSVCVGVYLMRVRYGHPSEPAPLGSVRLRRIVTAATVAAVSVALVLGASSDPLLKQTAAAARAIPWRVNVGANGLPRPTARQAMQLPRVTEKLDGSPQEPIGLVFVGTQRELVGAFTSAGWSIADPPTLATLLHAIVSAFSNQPYLTGPVTPSFLDGQVQTIAFEKPAGQATIRRRHHCRWWRTDLTFNGKPVWVASASFDQALEIGSAIPLPTHKIAPDIDAEQRYIANDLRGRRVAIAGRVRVAPASTGTNAQGDSWFTSGLATVMVATP